MARSSARSSTAELRLGSSKRDRTYKSGTSKSAKPAINGEKKIDNKNQPKPERPRFWAALPITNERTNQSMTANNIIALLSFLAAYIGGQLPPFIDWMCQNVA
jgi:hypothetical protein